MWKMSSLPMRVLLGSLIPVVIGALLCVVYWPMRRGGDALDALARQAKGNVGVLRQHVEADLTEPAALQVQLAQSISREAGLLAIAVRRQGTILAQASLPGHADLLVPGATQALVDDRHVTVTKLKDEAELLLVLDASGVAAIRRSAMIEVLILALFLIPSAIAVSWWIARRLVQPLLAASTGLGGLAQSLIASAREQEASAGESATAIGETRRMMETVVATAQQISDNCVAVLSNAEHTLNGNREIAGRISELSSQSERVAEILAGIMKVADRTDLLALNAGLEGTKAGEAGRGFALVALEMRRLAENTMQSVQNINGLISDVRERAQAATDASGAGMRLSEETADSARMIARTTQEQRSATEQVGTSMDEMSELLRHNLVNIQATAQTAAAVAEVSAQLAKLVGQATP